MTIAPGPIVRVGGRGSSWLRLALRGALVSAVVVSLSAGSASLAAAADTCPNTAVRVQTGSTALPDCRGYEMVSPPYKEGFPVDPGVLRFTDDGLVSYRTIGNFADNAQGAPLLPYHATRSAAGWLTTALSPPDVTYDTGGGVPLESADLRWSEWLMKRRGVPGEKNGFYRRGSDGVFTRIGDGEDDSGTRFIVAFTDDFSHLLFNYAGVLHENVGTGGEPLVRAVGIDNQGQAQGVSETCPNSVSPDGRVIVYTVGCNGGPMLQVWARVAGSATVAVSGSECTRSPGDPGGACNSASTATYAGAAVDGSRVFFTTAQQLVNGDVDVDNDLYACDIPAGAPTPVGSANRCASLTEVSGTANNAQVENVVKVSADGSRAYFVARKVLAGNLGVGGALASDGSPNLYLWQRDAAHPAGETRFVASLLGAGGNDLARVQMTPDGRYLLFLTTSRLVTSGPGEDTDDAIDAYRYDTVTNTVVRVSTSISGSGGNGSGFDVSMVIQASSITTDGSTVIFDTDEALSVSDTDGVTDVYAWRDGQVSLISAGGGKSAGISSSGRDMFFTTDAQVLAVDGDFNKDIYDARIGGGFEQVQTTPCTGDGCRGPRSDPPNLARPLSTVPGVSALTEALPVFSLRALSAAQRKGLAATGKVSLTVTTNAPGTVSVKGTATIGSRSVTVGSARRTLAAPGRVAVNLSLSRRARNQLAVRGRLTVKVAVSHSKVALDRLVTLRLVRAKAKRSVASRSSVAGEGGGRS